MILIMNLELGFLRKYKLHKAGLHDYEGSIYDILAMDYVYKNYNTDVDIVEYIHELSSLKKHTDFLRTNFFEKYKDVDGSTIKDIARDIGIILTEIEKDI